MVAYTPGSKYDCAACTIDRSLDRQCLRKLRPYDPASPLSLDDPHAQLRIKTWTKPGDDRYLRDTCWRSLVTADHWQTIDDARQYVRHGTMARGGGRLDQPLWWWRRVEVVLDEVGRLEDARQQPDDALSKAIAEYQRRATVATMRRG